ncbi:hypothetical protein [uncultured Paenibacillus sp.]|uniref:hypothetical protein n=1 Tax=uncultured Paenibacillus sp. TaxID=227322 RepID=UPI0028D622DA|nr:hypothetical protein [uncultured Paenibacillus sp.]
MTTKYSRKTGASAGSFAPFPVGKEELVLTSVYMDGLAPNDRIVLKPEIGWAKPVHWDTGELEVMLRENSPDGQVVYWTLETCFEKALTSESCTVRGGKSVKVFYLTVRSSEERAMITGPYSLQGTVFAE